MQPLIPETVIAAAIAARHRWQIPASVSLAQWADESGWNRYFPGGSSSNNPFGIKAVGDEPAVVAHTREEDKYGRSYYVDARFRVFQSLSEAFDQHAELLATGAPYAHCRTVLPNAEAFAQSLTGVYATDHLYGAKLISIMRQHHLYVYDVDPKLLPVAAAVTVPMAPSATSNPVVAPPVAPAVVSGAAANKG